MSRDSCGPPVDEGDARVFLRLILSPRIEDVRQADCAVGRLGFTTILLLLTSAIGQLLTRRWPQQMPPHSTAVRYCWTAAVAIPRDGSGPKMDADVLVQVMNLYYRPESVKHVPPAELVRHMMHLSRYMAGELDPATVPLSELVEATVADCRHHLADPDLLPRSAQNTILVPQQKGPRHV